MRLLIKHKVNTTKTRSPLYGHLSDSSFHVLVRLDLLYTNITSKHTSRHKKRKFQKSRILRPAHFTEELLVITYYIFSRIKESRNQGIKDYTPNLRRPNSTFALLYSSSFCEKWYFDRDPSCSYGLERSPNFFNCFFLHFFSFFFSSFFWTTNTWRQITKKSSFFVCTSLLLVELWKMVLWSGS